MSAGLAQKSRGTNAPVSLAATADNICVIAGPVKIHRFLTHQTVAKTTGTAGVFQMQSVAGVTETVLGTATQPDTIAVGATVVKEFNPPLVVAAGAWFKAELTTAANAGSALCAVEFVEDPLTKTYLDTLVAMT